VGGWGGLVVLGGVGVGGGGVGGGGGWGVVGVEVGGGGVVGWGGRSHVGYSRDQPTLRGRIQPPLPRLGDRVYRS